eukprot:1160080-Pelagomonas_calceolata.AAC.13
MQPYLPVSHLKRSELRVCVFSSSLHRWKGYSEADDSTLNLQGLVNCAGGGKDFGNLKALKGIGQLRMGSILRPPSKEEQQRGSSVQPVHATRISHLLSEQLGTECHCRNTWETHF